MSGLLPSSDQPESDCAHPRTKCSTRIQFERKSHRMSSPPVQHPDDRLVIAFNLGKLNDREAAAINKHLKECQTCRRRLVRLSAEVNVSGPPANDPAPAVGVEGLAAAVQADREERPAILRGTSDRWPKFVWPSAALGPWPKFVWPSAAFAALLLGLVIAWIAGAFKATTSAALTAVENRQIPVQPQPPTQQPPTQQPPTSTSQTPDAPPIRERPTTSSPPASNPSPAPAPSSPPPSQLSEDKPAPKVENLAERASPNVTPDDHPAPKAPATETPPNNAKDLSQEFFNGKDLAGWQGSSDVWHVENGSITGSLPAGQKQSMFLCSQQKYKDFDLRFRVSLAEGIGDCGVQFRSLVIDSGNKSQVVGPECAIYGKDAPKEHRTGSLITEPHSKVEKAPPPKRVERFVKPTENHFRIRCQGKHVLIEVNGVKMVNDEFPSLPEEGVIAWKIDANRPPHKVTFKITSSPT